MDRCESFWEWDEKFKQELCHELSKISWNSYKEIERQEFMTREKLSNFLKVDVSSVSLMCGGFDAIFNFMLSQASENFHVHENSFYGYRYVAKILSRNIVEKKQKDLLESKEAKIICTPTNPSGIRLEDEVILEDCIRVNPVFIDKTYYYFCRHPKNDTIMMEKNIVTNISLSKSLSMASLRASFLVGDSSLIADINKVKRPFHVSVLTSLAIRKVFDEKWVEYFYERALELDEIRNKKSRELSALVFEDPEANFLSINKDQNVPSDIISSSREMSGFYRLTLRRDNEK